MRQTRALPACSTAKYLKTPGCPTLAASLFLRLGWDPNSLRRSFRRELFLLHSLAQNHRQVAPCGIQHRSQPLRR